MVRDVLFGGLRISDAIISNVSAKIGFTIFRHFARMSFFYVFLNAEIYSN